VGLDNEERVALVRLVKKKNGGPPVSLVLFVRPMLDWC
jgi:hypothetical protein